MIVERVEDLLAPRTGEEEIFDDDWSDVVDYGRPLGTCANCGDTIFLGEGGPTVHDYCAAAFAAYLNSPEARGDWRDDD